MIFRPVIYNKNTLEQLFLCPNFAIIPAMAKTKTQYVCQECGSIQPKWMGRCPDCGEWNTLVETVVESAKFGFSAASAAQGLAGRSMPQSLTAIVADNYHRTMLPMEEFNRVLGGGLVPGWPGY